MNSDIDTAITNAFSDLRKAGRTHPLNHAYEDIASSTASMSAKEQKQFFAGLNTRVRDAHLTDLSITGLDTDAKKIVFADKSHHQYEGSTLQHMKPLSQESAPSLGHGFGRGIGVWMNRFHYPNNESQIQSYCHKLQENGISNLYLQMPLPEDAHAKMPIVMSILEECHRDGISVVAWARPPLVAPKHEAQYLASFGRMKTQHGQKVDGIAADLEDNVSTSHVRSFSQTLRNSLGWKYPIGGIVYSPLNGSAEAKNTPWQIIGQYYNKIMPMDYWEKKPSGTYTTQTIEQIHNLTRKPVSDIQVIGDGIATGTRSVESFLRSAHEDGVTSVSLYPNNVVTTEQLRTLKQYSKLFR